MSHIYPGSSSSLWRKEPPYCHLHLFRSPETPQETSGCIKNESKESWSFSKDTSHWWSSVITAVVQPLSHVHSLRPLGLQHASLPCPSSSSGACSNSCPLCWWCHPAISSSVIPFSSYLQSFPASGSFLMSRLFSSGGQSIGAPVSASFRPKYP